MTELNGAIISLGSISSKWIVEEMKKHFTHVDHLDIKDLEVSLGKKAEILYRGKPLSSYDCIYARGSFRYATLLRSLTALLSKSCYLPLDSEAYTIGHDKILTHLKLQTAGIPMPKTYIVATAEAGKKIIKKTQYPIVLKLPSGTHGKGVMLADSHESASSMIDALALLKQPFLIQEYIETGGTDTRVIVVGETAVAGMKRVAVKGEKRANIHMGGQGRAIKLDETIRKLAVKAARACSCDICAVDILQGPNGPVVIEINLSPGLQGITQVTGINVANMIAEELFTKAKEFKHGLKEKEKKQVMKELFPSQEFTSKLTFRGERILLPTEVTKFGKFDEDDEVIIKTEKGKTTIEKFQ